MAAPGSGAHTSNVEFSPVRLVESFPRYPIRRQLPPMPLSDLVNTFGRDLLRHTLPAREWRAGGYRPPAGVHRLGIACDLIERASAEISLHRTSATAGRDILLAAACCAENGAALSGIDAEPHRRATAQGARATAANRTATNTETDPWNSSAPPVTCRR